MWLLVLRYRRYSSRVGHPEWYINCGLEVDVIGPLMKLDYLLEIKLGHLPFPDLRFQ